MGCWRPLAFRARPFCHYCSQFFIPNRICCGSLCRRSVTSYRRLVIAFSFHDAKTGECPSGAGPDPFSRAYIARAFLKKLPLKVNDLTALILTSNEEENFGRNLVAFRLVAAVVIIGSISTGRCV